MSDLGRSRWINNKNKWVHSPLHSQLGTYFLIIRMFRYIAWRAKSKLLKRRAKYCYICIFKNSNTAVRNDVHLNNSFRSKHYNVVEMQEYLRKLSVLFLIRIWEYCILAFLEKCCLYLFFQIMWFFYIFFKFPPSQ